MRLRNRRGDALVIVLMMVLAAGVGAYVVSDLFKKTVVIQQRVDSLSVLTTIEDSIVWSIENDEAWKVDMANSGGTMSCLTYNGAVCTPSGGIPFVVYLEDGTTVYADGRPASNLGFDYSGVACAGFSPTVPNDRCPFKFTITWKPVCSGVCQPTLLSVANGVPIDPQVQIDISLSFSGTKEQYKRINLTNFIRSFVRGSVNGSLASSCRAALGSFNPQTQTCQLSNMPGGRGCPTGQMLSGFDPSGNPVCTKNPYTVAGCGTGFAPVDVDENGWLCWKF